MPIFATGGLQIRQNRRRHTALNDVPLCFYRCAAPCLAGRFLWAKLWFQRFVNLFPDVLEDCVAEATLLPNLATLAVEEVVLWYPA